MLNKAIIEASCKKHADTLQTGLWQLGVVDGVLAPDDCGCALSAVARDHKIKFYDASLLQCDFILSFAKFFDVDYEVVGAFVNGFDGIDYEGFWVDIYNFGVEMRKKYVTN